MRTVSHKYRDYSLTMTNLPPTHPPHVGVTLQTESLLRLALGECIRPVLAVSKMDRCFLELKMDAEDAYSSLVHVVNNINVVVATCQDKAMGDLQVRSGRTTVQGGQQSLTGCNIPYHTKGGSSITGRGQGDDLQVAAGKRAGAQQQGRAQQRGGAAGRGGCKGLGGKLRRG